MRTRPLIALLLLAAPASADPPPLRDALLARARQAPIYLTFGETGVAAGDGAWSVPIVDGPVAAAAFDPAQDLVWLVRRGRLEVLDLREPAPKPVPIVERWWIATGGYASQATIEVTGVSTASTENTYAGVYPKLVFSARPKIETDAGAYGGIWEDQDAAAKKAIRKAKIVGGKWLAAQVGRRAHAASAGRLGWEAEATTSKVALPEGMGQCEEPELCGSAQAFGKTGWKIVLVEHSCGDACHTGCVLFDPATKRFASPGAPAGWGKSAEAESCDGYRFDDSGTRYLNEAQVCTMKACAKLDKAMAFGWLGGGKP